MKMTKENKKKKEQTIEFLGEKLDPKHYPILYRWARRNPETLKSQLLSLTRLPGGSVESAIQSLRE